MLPLLPSMRFFLTEISLEKIQTESS
jgi:hypothetical protein